MVGRWPPWEAPGLQLLLILPSLPQPPLDQRKNTNKNYCNERQTAVSDMASA